MDTVVRYRRSRYTLLHMFLEKGTIRIVSIIVAVVTILSMVIFMLIPMFS